MLKCFWPTEMHQLLKLDHVGYHLHSNKAKQYIIFKANYEGGSKCCVLPLNPIIGCHVQGNIYITQDVVRAI